SGQGVNGSHGRTEVARMGRHLHLACVNLGGEGRLIHGDEELALRRGDVFLIDSRRRFALGLEQPWRHLVVAFPTHWLDGRLARPELASGAVLRDQPLAQLWARHLADGYSLADALSPDAETLFARHSVELLAQALNDHQDPSPMPSEAARAALFLRGCRLISLEFGDPRLTPARIAAKLRVSARTLDRIFAERNETVMRRVYDERIRQAAKLLADETAAHRSVTEIAFACGFNDGSHFGRVFAGRMQITPSHWRQQQRDRPLATVCDSAWSPMGSSRTARVSS
ncbi:MAG TPA: helix-turn-helix domain-containing protein, partial [Stellaceae bacterium]|nr:helix-turn-helix domain-containing protein [Stellaceae bacterium]